ALEGRWSIGRQVVGVGVHGGFEISQLLLHARLKGDAFGAIGWVFGGHEAGRTVESIVQMAIGALAAGSEVVALPFQTGTEGLLVERAERVIDAGQIALD